MWTSDSSRDSSMSSHVGCFSLSDVEPCDDCAHQVTTTTTTPYCMTVGIDRSFPLPPYLLIEQKSPSSSDANCRSLSSATSFWLSTDDDGASQPSQSRCMNNNGCVEKTVEWINNVQLADSFLGHRTQSPMCSKDSPSGSNRSSTSSSNSSGYLGSTNQVNHPSPSGRQSRLSGQSCESGISSLSSSHCGYLSGSTSSHTSLDRLEQGVGHSTAVGINDHKEPEILRSWLNDLNLLEYYPLFLQAGYDMPTITRMTPEDLTAIGITQPAVRKRLTFEINKLQICDGIPNYMPNSLMEWLQCLHLEQYLSILTNDGYDDLGRITDIIWEDLEEIGIHKLGHQKKIMLAIDRLKKLYTSTRKMSSMDGSQCSHNAMMDPPVMPMILEKFPPPSNLFTIDPSRPTDRGRRVSRSLSGDSLTFSSSSGEPRPDRALRTSPEIIHLRPQAAIPHLQRSEVVAIQVNHVTTTRSRLSSSAADRRESGDASCNQVRYESFHGNPSKDFQCLLKETDNGSDATQTDDRGVASSSDETASSASSSGAGGGSGTVIKLRPQLAPKPKLDRRMRRASGGSSPCTADATEPTPNVTLQRHGSFRGRYDRRERFAGDGLAAEAEAAKEGNSNKELPRPTSAAVSSYRSAPCTPAHVVPAASTALWQGRPKRTPPPPLPRRSNSVRDDAVTKAEFENHNLPKDQVKVQSSCWRMESDETPTEQRSKNFLKFNSALSKIDHHLPTKPRSSSTEIDVDGFCGDVTTKYCDITTRFGDVTAKCGDVTAKFGDVTAKFGDVTAKCGDVTAKCGNVVTAKFGDITAKQAESRMNRSYEQEVHQQNESFSFSQSSPPQERTVLPAEQPGSRCASSSSDCCNTLPFANENIGTIKQRSAAGNKPTTTEKEETEVKHLDDVLPSINNNTTQKKKPVPMQKPKKLTNELETIDRSGRTEPEETANNIFNDIDSLFDGLSQELDEMLTFQG